MRWPLFFLCGVLSASSQAPLRDEPQIQRALQYLEEHQDQHTAKHIQISEIPAPGGEEQQRAAFLQAEFQRAGLTGVEIDKAGNVLGWRPGKTERAIVVAAHLDTVFLRSVDVKVRRDGKRLYGPGLADDSRGLLALLALAEALNTGAVQTNRTILFVADVGEEGLGNLRGIRYLTGEGPHRARFDAFLSIDGTAPERVVNAELGSRRYRFTVKGPGGHSYGAFGTGNPAHALGRVMAKVAGLTVPTNPKTTFSIGRLGGGVSINAIPEEAWFELDVRSVEEAQLVHMEALLRELAQQGVEEENAQKVKTGPPLTLDLRVLAVRHAFPNPANQLLVESARQAAQELGMAEIHLETASTDSNAAMQASLPAITIGGGGRSGGTHSPGEWFEPEGAYRGLQQALLLILGYDRKLK
jgi:acetylornithine deacetylase/succinyl-diaminopimelate desuccinylase-like protein